MANQSIEKMIKTQFQKAKNRGYADNFKFEGEKCIVRIYATDLTQYHLTDQGISLESSGEGLREIARYQDIARLHWMSQKPPRTSEEAIRFKTHNYDTLILETEDNKNITLNNLGDSFQPLGEFIEWYLRIRE